MVIGNFDGVHRGHQALITAAIDTAHSLGLTPLILTFDPHPATVLGRGVRPPLTPIERKTELLLQLSEALEVVVEPFTKELSLRSPEEFAAEVLSRRLQARVVIVGEDFRFGHQRTGGLAELRALGQRLGFEARAEGLVGDAEGVFSSTRAREALEGGDLAGVERCLGRAHALSGRVVHGAARGRTLGFPTANLDGVLEALPPFGVYACRAEHLDTPARGLTPAVLNIGLRPTLAAGFSVEAHLLDFSGDLYDQRLRLHLTARLRDELRFSGLPALQAQIQQDVEQARRLLSA